MKFSLESLLYSVLAWLLNKFPLYASLADLYQSLLKQILEKNVALDKDILQQEQEQSNKTPFSTVKYVLLSAFHTKLPDQTRFRQQLLQSCSFWMQSLTSFLQNLPLIPEQRSAEIRIHVKQDVDRRIPPGRNPGSGSTW
jgi:hypothetical protein